MNSLRKLMGFRQRPSCWRRCVAGRCGALQSRSVLRCLRASDGAQPGAVSVMITNTGNSTANSFEVDWTESPDITVLSASAGGVTVTTFSQD